MGNHSDDVDVIIVSPSNMRTFLYGTYCLCYPPTIQYIRSEDSLSLCFFASSSVFSLSLSGCFWSRRLISLYIQSLLYYYYYNYVHESWIDSTLAQFSSTIYTWIYILYFGSHCGVVVVGRIELYSIQVGSLWYCSVNLDGRLGICRLPKVPEY